MVTNSIEEGGHIVAGYYVAVLLQSGVLYTAQFVREFSLHTQSGNLSSLK